MDLLRVFLRRWQSVPSSPYRRIPTNRLSNTYEMWHKDQVDQVFWRITPEKTC